MYNQAKCPWLILLTSLLFCIMSRYTIVNHFLIYHCTELTDRQNARTYHWIIKKKSWITNISRWRFIKKRNCSFRNISNIWLLAFVLRSQLRVAEKIWIVPGTLKDSKGTEQNNDSHYYAIRAFHLLINDYSWTMCYVIQNILAYTYLQLLYGWVTLN